MAKTQRTPEQVEAMRARMAKVRAGRQNQNPETKHIPVKEVEEEDTIPVTQPDIPPTEQITPPSVTELTRQVQELKDMMFQMAMNQGQNPSNNSNSPSMVGTTEKFSVQTDLYPNMNTRLADEPKLQRFAFKMNYELEYIQTVTEYTTIDKIRMKEPKFELRLIRIMLDEITGDDSGGRYVVCNLIFFEDPETALVIAKREGLDVEAMGEREFLNEMRYLRMRDWLLDCFYPPSLNDVSQRKDMVINGKLVQYYQKTNEEGNSVGKLDWDTIAKSKL